MKQKFLQTIKVAFLLTFLLAEFFGFGVVIKFASAANCTVTASWDDTSNNPLGNVTSASQGQSYEAVATYKGCAGFTQPALGLTTPSGTQIVGLGGAIQSNNEQRNAVVNFSQHGSYYFTADVVQSQGLNGATVYNTDQPSSRITIASCTITATWADSNNNPINTTVVAIGQTYHAIATFNSCVGDSVAFRFFGGGYGSTIGTPQDIGGNITQASEQRYANFTFSQAGDSYFRVGDSTAGINQDSSHITASANPASSGQPLITFGPALGGTVPPGGNVTVTCSGFSSLPASANQVIVVVNGTEISQSIPISNGQCSATIAVTSANGFNGSGSNSINAWVADSNGSQVDNTPDVSGSFTVAAAGTSSSGGAPDRGVCSTCFDNAGCDSGSCDLSANQCITGGVNSCSGSTCFANSGCASNNCDLTTNKCVGNTPSTSGAAGATAPAGAAMGNNSGTTLFNPLPEQDLTHVFLLVIQGLLGILGVFAVAFIIVGAVQMIVASGNEEAITKAKKTIVWAVLGLVIALLSFSIIAIVEDFFQVNIPTPTSITTSVNKYL